MHDKRWLLIKLEIPKRYPTIPIQHKSGIILDMGLAIERRHYMVTPPAIGGAISKMIPARLKHFFCCNELLSLMFNLLSFDTKPESTRFKLTFLVPFLPVFSVFPVNHRRTCTGLAFVAEMKQGHQYDR